MSAPSGRYAPSPTGEMHLGNASSALLAWASVRARGGRFVMRMEDLDRGRSRAELADRVLQDLRWLGIDWDEGPDVGGPFAPYTQSERMERYRSAAQRLHDEGRLYPCFCTRKEIAAAASAPQEPGEQRRYPGTCRGLSADESQGRIAAGDRHAWRFRVSDDARPLFVDRVHGEVRSARAPGDFVVHRADGVIAYQLAVVVDDIAMGIDEVVRGDDLLGSTPWQCLLFEAFEAPQPVFAHVPLLLGDDGARLSKRHAGITLRELREQGVSAGVVVDELARLLGLAGFSDFEWGKLARRPDGIAIDLERFRRA